jgi:hypothetical protein
MQGILSAKPNLVELYNLIEKVPRFPVSNQQLLNLAARRRAPKEVVDFYRSFGNQTYKNKDDLTARTEQVDLMRQEESKMPKEEEVAAEDF